MELAILGLPGCGKSTLFEIMTGIGSRGCHGEKGVRGQAEVPDRRLEDLAEVYQPQRVVPVRITFVDLNISGDKLWETMRRELGQADGIVHVVDGFSLPEVGELCRNYHKLNDELILSDLQTVENRLQKTSVRSRKALDSKENEQHRVLTEGKERLEEGIPFRRQGLSEAEIFQLRGFGLWTVKPELIVINHHEDKQELVEDFRNLADRSEEVLGISCKLEAELANLTPPEQKEYLESLGYGESAFGRVVQAAFRVLERIAFFTVGDKEVRAWAIPAGIRAPGAAGTIHNDFERGFIRAEVIGYEDFTACGLSMSRAKALGKVRLEGKDYQVKDGDVVTFRFNVGRPGAGRPG